MTSAIYFRVAADSTLNAPASVHRVCIHCEGETFFLMSTEEYNKWQVRNLYVQNVFPHLDKDVREWMISGTHPECWNQVFGDEEDY
jgi:hypothetical protein